MYLTSWEEDGYLREENDMIKEVKIKTCWKGYSFDVLNKLTDEEYLYFSKGNNFLLLITPGSILNFSYGLSPINPISTLSNFLDSSLLEIKEFKYL